MLFYILFPAFLFLLNKNARVFLIATILLFGASQIIHWKYFAVKWGDGNHMADFVFFNPVMHMSQFMIGMLGGYLYQTKKWVKLHWSVNLVLFIIN